MPRHKPVIDRRLLYIPQPSKWDFSKLSDEELMKRTKAAEQAKAVLLGWKQQLYLEMDGKRAELFATLETAKLMEVQEANREFDEIAKEMRAIDRLVGQVNSAIKAIQGHASSDTMALT